MPTPRDRVACSAGIPSDADCGGAGGKHGFLKVRCIMTAYADAFGAKHRNAVDLTADIVSAYVSNNPALPDEMPGILAAVHAALVRLSRGGTVRKPTAASIRRSVTCEALISFEDGKPYKTLKRHLGALGLSPEAYREKWSLPRDYPLVTASYSAQRSATAKRLGLGRPGRTDTARLFVVARAPGHAEACRDEGDGRSDGCSPHLRAGHRRVGRLPPGPTRPGASRRTPRRRSPHANVQEDSDARSLDHAARDGRTRRHVLA